MVSALGGNVLTDRLVVPGALLGISQSSKTIRNHAAAFLLALLPSLWISWALAPFLAFLGGYQWIAFLGIAEAVAWAEQRAAERWVAGPGFVDPLGFLTTNCAYIGSVLLAFSGEQGFWWVSAKGLGSAAGYGLVLYLAATLRIRLAGAPVPKSFRGLPSVLILLGFLAMVLMGFAQAFHLYPPGLP